MKHVFPVLYVLSTNRCFLSLRLLLKKLTVTTRKETYQIRKKTHRRQADKMSQFYQHKT